MPRFETPGRLRDAPSGSPFYDRWDGQLRDMFGSAVDEGDVVGARDIDDDTRHLGGFYSPVRSDFPPVGSRTLVWIGFPRSLLVRGDPGGRRDAFADGDTRDQTISGRSTQVEYLEWHVTRRQEDGKITKVTFSTETPEYWSTLYGSHPEVVLNRYRTLLGRPSIQLNDIAPSNVYDPLNDWNTRLGIIHYIVNSPANTLEAAVALARGSVGGEAVRDNYELPRDRVTAADPRVNIDLKMLARQDLWVTLREPVGLYMIDFDDTGWTKPDGTPVGNYWRVIRPGPQLRRPLARGHRGRQLGQLRRSEPRPAYPALRVEYAVPASESFVVGDILIGGRRIEYGGQLSEHITVMVGGIAVRRR